MTAKTTLSSLNESLKFPFRLNLNPNLPNVAAILDDFSTLSFSSAANLWLIDPLSPEIDLDVIEPDFLLVESAWSGNSGRWRYMVTSSHGPKEPLIRLINQCKKRDIPTVFWNKEDPPHFEEFIKTAQIFDYIFTSDANMLEAYATKAPNAPAQLLRFAVSPTLHNPRRVPEYREKAFAFAGQYFRHKFPERREQMDLLFPVAAKWGLDIYSRVLGGDEQYQFPEKYAHLVIGSLPYFEMVQAYKKYRAFINVNSVVNSTTMCARRVFELSGCKTGVFGLDSAAIHSVYDESEILLAKDLNTAEEIAELLAADDQQLAALTQRAWRKTLSSHTYSERIDEIRRAIGLDVPVTKVIFEVTSSSQALSQQVVKEIRSQKFTGSSTNFEVRFVDARYNWPAPRETSSKEHQIELTFKVVVNNDFSYGEHYLNDLYLAFTQSNARRVAKASLESSRLPEDYYDLYEPGWGYIEYLGSQIFRNSVASDFPREITEQLYLSDSFDVTRKSAY